jgi:predicted Zn-dependent protease
VGQREVDARIRAEEPLAGDNTAPPSDGEGEAGPRAPRTRAPRGTPASATNATPKASYLLTLAKVKDLYRTRNYEIALVELVALEKQYPNDERIMSMKGSLYEKVGRRQLAREAWEAVLALNPYNLQVAEALQRLGK